MPKYMPSYRIKELQTTVNRSINHNEIKVYSTGIVSFLNIIVIHIFRSSIQYTLYFNYFVTLIIVTVNMRFLPRVQILFFVILSH